MEKTRARIGARLKRARVARGFTLKQVGEFVGRNQQSIWRYEAGLTDPSVDLLTKLADLYGVTLASLVDPRNAKGVKSADGEAA